jgi:hypothetical protein
LDTVLLSSLAWSTAGLAILDAALLSLPVESTAGLAHSDNPALLMALASMLTELGLEPAGITVAVGDPTPAGMLLCGAVA